MRKGTFTFFAFLYAFALSSQTHQWVMPLGGDWFDFGHAVTVDDSGYVYSTGQFSTRSDFDPLASRLLRIQSNGFYDIYVHKADSNGNVVWARGMGGNLQDSGEDIAVDDSGNVYTTGYFRNTVDFDPGAGTFNLTSNGTTDIFVQKLDANGNFLWAVSMGDNMNDEGRSILIDDSSNVIISGLFMNNVDFDPDTSNFLVNAGPNSGAFVLKLGPNGKFKWVKTFNGASTRVILSSAKDDSGNLYSTGYFRGTVDFDPDPNRVFNLTSVFNDDVFVQKMDASGNFLWATSLRGNGEERAESISVDTLGSVVITGHFSNGIDLNPDTSIIVSARSAGDVDLFIVKLDPSGNYMWGMNAGAASRDRGECVVQDRFSNVYVIGQYGFTVDFDPSAATANLTYLGAADIFVLKLDAAGNFNWVQSVGSFDIDVGEGITVDKKDNLYTTGYFQSQVDFDIGTGLDNRIAAGWNDIFVQKFGQLNNTVGIEKNLNAQNLNVLAYPNPTSEILKIRLPEILKDVNLELRDATGKVVYMNHYKALLQTSIPLNGMQGMYFLKLASPQGQSVVKILKQ